jgi:Putative RNA methylase family UPF0020
MLCPAGFEAIVADTARRELPKVSVERRSSGFIRVRTVAPVRQLREFPCATNVFDVLDEVPRSTVDRELMALRRRLPRIERPPGLPMRGSVRLRVHDDGQFAGTNARLSAELERDLASWSGLVVARSGAALEVWVLRRRDEPSTILATKLSKGVRRSAPGVLRPEICGALARVEPLRRARLVLDPFAGSGVIGEACLEAGAECVWLNDVKGNQRSGGRVRWTHQSTLRLAVAPASVDAIVTDPPWGNFSPVPGGVDGLYSGIGRAAAEWLRPGGAIVALTGAPEAAIKELVQGGELSLERDYHVLISGRKARIIRARKKVAQGK